jgi:hypothetical protein
MVDASRNEGLWLRRAYESEHLLVCLEGKYTRTQTSNLHIVPKTWNEKSV